MLGVVAVRELFVLRCLNESAVTSFEVRTYRNILVFHSALTKVAQINERLYSVP